MVEHDRLDAIDGAGQPAPMTMILIRNAQVYAPEPLGQRDLLLGAGKLLWIGSAAPDLPPIAKGHHLDQELTFGQVAVTGDGRGGAVAVVVILHAEGLPQTRGGP